MTTGNLVNVALVLVFVLIGGVFAATEIALVSLRESQLRDFERRGDRGRRVADLARNPNRFLSAVQIGVTVAGFFSAAFGATTLAPDISPTLEQWGLSEGVASAVALVGTTLVVSYLSLVLGELVPKRLALQRAAGVSLATGPALDRFAAVMRPVIWLLSISTDALVRLLGGDPSRKKEDVTPDELRELLIAHEAVPEDERIVLTELFDVGSRRLVEVMRPRPEVHFLEADTPWEEAIEFALEKAHSRYPVTADTVDHILGFVHVRDLLLAARGGEHGVVSDLCRPILAMPGSKPALAALTVMRRNNAQIGLVVDEYGGTAGIVTVEDIVEEVVGEIGDEFDPPEEQGGPDTVSGAGRSAPAPRATLNQQIEGSLHTEDFAHLTGLNLPDGPYDTVAGYLLHEFQHLPRPGEGISVDGYRLTVTELDGRRVARVLLSRAPTGEAGPREG